MINLLNTKYEPVVLVGYLWDYNLNVSEKQFCSPIDSLQPFLFIHVATGLSRNKAKANPCNVINEA